MFTRRIASLVSDEDLPPIPVPVGGGIRKVRLAASSRGKRGARVIYYWAARRHVIVLLYVFAKNEAADLTPKQVTQLAKIIKEEFANEGSDV